MDATVVIDASVWVSRLVHQDTNHYASRLWVTRYIAAGGFLVAPTLLVIEVAASISRQTGQLALAKAEAKNLYSIPSIRLMPLDSELVWAAVEVAADLQLRTGDATYVAIAHQLNIPLVSWDKEQLQRAGSIITTYTPGTYTF
jgi:predicted nucleic acid-binding protein